MSGPYNTTRVILTVYMFLWVTKYLLYRSIINEIYTAIKACGRKQLIHLGCLSSKDQRWNCSVRTHSHVIINSYYKYKTEPFSETFYVLQHFLWTKKKTNEDDHLTFVYGIYEAHSKMAIKNSHRSSTSDRSHSLPFPL